MGYDFIKEVADYQSKANKLGIAGPSHCEDHVKSTPACDDCEYRLDSAIRRISFVEQRA